MFIVLSISLAALLPMGLTPAQAQDARFEFAEPHMGTAFRVVLFAADSAEAATAANAAFAAVADLDARLSDWDPDSELSRLGEIAGTGVGREVSPELWDALSLAHDWAERTDGAFDPTVGPLSRLWRWSARRGELPDSARLAEARVAVGWRHLVLERVKGRAGGAAEPDIGRAVAPSRRVVYLERPGMALDLGGIAKGIAADAALAELARRGISAALVDAGGDVAVGDPPPGEDGWRVAVEDGHTLVLARAGVATSGGGFRTFEAGGVRYSHIVDPRTGLGMTAPRNVTVVASDAATADALASALSVMDRAERRELVASEPAARVVLRPGPTEPEPGARP